MKHFALFTIFLLILSAVGAQRANAASSSKIYRITLSDDKSIQRLSQQFSITITAAPVERTFIFVELLERDEIFRFRTIPSHVPIEYDLIYHSSIDQRKDIIQVNSTTSNIIHPYKSSESEAYYSFDDSKVFLKIGDLLSLGPPLTISREDSAVSLNGSQFEVSFVPQAVLNSFNILLEASIDLPSDPDLTHITPVYQFDIHDKEMIDLSFPIKLKIKYTDSNNDASKSIYYFDKGIQRWVQLPSYNNVEENFVEANIHLPYAPITILSDNSSSDGIASWYAYRDCLCAASRDFPKGFELKVTRLKSGKSVIVTINDYGPELWTGRIIDLDKTAFEKIGSLRAGLIYVNVEPHD